MKSGEKHLRQLNRSGDYRAAIRFQLAQDALADESPAGLTAAAKREVQFAVALQHAGYFGLALDAYRSASALAYAGNGLRKSFQDRIDIQLAALNERLGRYEDAWRLLSAVRTPAASTSRHVAKMSDADWHFVTYMKTCLRLADFPRARERLATYRLVSDHAKDWASLFAIAIRIGEGGRVEDEDLRVLGEARASYSSYDQPGEPWLTLFLSPYLSSGGALECIEALEESLTQAERMGKFFLVAALNEELARCHILLNRRSDAESSFTRAVNAFGKCQVLLQNPLRSRLARLAVEVGIDQTDLGRMALSSSGLTDDPSQFRFSEMCARHGLAYNISPDRAFEHFVTLWAQLRYPGEMVALPEGQTAVDVLLVRIVDGRKVGIAVQAKHYLDPRKSLPKSNPKLRTVCVEYNLDRLERYVFVVSTKSRGGWRDSMWHAQDSDTVRNYVQEPATKVDIVLEPQLQNDVMLNDSLWRRFFLG